MKYGEPETVEEALEWVARSECGRAATEAVRLLREEVLLLRQRLFVRARASRSHEKGYSDEDMETMFGPFLFHGDTTDLSPRECRLIESVANRNATIASLSAKEGAET